MAQLLCACPRFADLIAAFSIMLLLRKAVGGASDGQADSKLCDSGGASFEFIFKISASFTHT